VYLYNSGNSSNSFSTVPLTLSKASAHSSVFLVASCKAFCSSFNSSVKDLKSLTLFFISDN
jgi:hypothetical protein